MKANHNDRLGEQEINRVVSDMSKIVQANETPNLFERFTMSADYLRRRQRYKFKSKSQRIVGRILQNLGVFDISMMFQSE